MGKRGPKPLPGIIHELNGFPGHHKPRPEIRPEPIMPMKPETLSPYASELWDELAPELGKNALLTKRDAESFTLLCENGAIAREALEELHRNFRTNRKGKKYTLIASTANGTLKRHPAYEIFTRAQSEFRRWAAEFGLTPVARVGLGVPGNPSPTLSIIDDEDDDGIFGT